MKTIIGHHPMRAIARPQPRAPVLVTLALTLLAACSGSGGGGSSGAAVRAPDRGLRHYAPPPAVGSFPASYERVEKWIRTGAVDSMRAHAWDLWASITSPTPDTTDGDLPVWETWYSGAELFGTGRGAPGLDAATEASRPGIRDFEIPRQIGRHGRIPLHPAEQVFSFNRYTRRTASFIWRHGLNRSRVLSDTNQAFTRAGTPIADRKLNASPDSVDALSVVLKPVFQFIRGDTATVVPVWTGDGPGSTTDTLNPTPDTWTAGVWVDPTGTMQPGDSVRGSVNGGPSKLLPVVSLDDFYHVVITAADSAAFSAYADSSGDIIGRWDSTTVQAVLSMIRPGNIGLLMAMHTTTKEIPNWTWNTFWWAPDPGDAHGADRPASIPLPWSHYDANVAYTMVQPDSQPLVTFNPYLETSLFGYWAPNPRNPQDSVPWYGVHTNCMTCHRMAVWPDSIGVRFPGYRPAGFVDPGDSIFAGFTKLDFLYSLQRAHHRPAARSSSSSTPSTPAHPGG